MDLTQLANLGEFVGGIAVLVTLIYLALQVRQVQRANRVAAFDKSFDSWNHICGETLDHYDLFCRGTDGYRDLSPRERLKFNFLMNQTFGYLENFYQKHRHGVIDLAEWNRQYQLVLWYIAWPGMDAYWKDVRVAFTEPFARLVDESFQGIENGSIVPPDVRGMYIGGDA